MSRVRQALNILLGRELIDLGLPRPGTLVRIGKVVYRLTSMSTNMSEHDLGQVELNFVPDHEYRKANQIDWGQQ